MTFNTLILCVVAASTTPWTHSLVRLEEQHIGSLVRSIFQEADADEDLLLNEKEFWRTFQNFDVDGNGEIERVEYVGLLLTGEIPAVRALGDSAAIASAGTQMFLMGDMNKNDVLDQMDAFIIMRNLDKNGDGNISQDEYTTRWEEIFRRLQS